MPPLVVCNSTGAPPPFNFPSKRRRLRSSGSSVSPVTDMPPFAQVATTVTSPRGTVGTIAVPAGAAADMFDRHVPAKWKADAPRLVLTDEGIDGAQSVVFDEAENRLHAQKGILAWCFGAGR